MEIVTEEKNAKRARINFGYIPIKKQYLQKILKKLPADACLVTVLQDPRTSVWGMVFVSDEFKTIKEGEVIPEMVAKMSKGEDGKEDVELLMTSDKSGAFLDWLKDT